MVLEINVHCCSILQHLYIALCIFGAPYAGVIHRHVAVVITVLSSTCAFVAAVKQSTLFSYLWLGSVLRMSLTQLAGYDCCRFHLILDHLVLRSLSWTCCHSNRSVSLNLLGSRLISCKQD